MKRKFLLSTALVTGLTVSSLLPAAYAHDELGDINIEKGERNPDEISSVPVTEGSKNVRYLHETAAVPLKEIREGVKNSTADVYAHKGFAYTGTHTAGGGNGGVRVFDLKDPSNPKEVAVFADQDIPGTWQEKVIVKTVNTKSFKGDLAVVSVQQLNVNNPDSKGGFLLYDVTNPYEPKKLGFYEVTKKTRGTHELYLTTQGNRVLVLAANPYADYNSHGKEKDFQLVDVTNPAEPKKLYEFDPRSLPEVSEDFDGYNWNAPDGKKRPVFNHSTFADETGKTAFLSFWDLGTIILDISNPENVKYAGRTTFASDQQGSAHSAALAKGGTVLVETREVYAPIKSGYEQSYGYTRIFDIKDVTNPTLLSEFKTDLTEDIPEDPTKQVTFGKTVHDPKVQGNTLYLSHYAGGVRAVDIANPSQPVQIGKYVPANANIWGVFVDQNYVLASDMGTGLKVLQKNNK
ncbi:LVIVD repeat-containing protein [Rossellomorea aquimaris]|uniref:LVIVD repeat-containing protein n=1 Tax=Rossellomorea aquimaris TaxID=189382 RepID=UPI0005C9E22D|nr:hypothetical protein [Rossellomorea aquimaris]